MTTLALKELTTNVLRGGTTASLALTADIGSAQGGCPLTSSFNVVSVCANAGDAVTLPAVFQAGTVIFIKNNGAASCDVFPASGDDAGAGANTAVAVANAKGIVFIATVANSTWATLMAGA
jgi:hypothetical protein